MEIIIKKGENKDYISAIRSDGTAVKTTFPKKGSYPHDAVHLFVEEQFGFKNAFWGLVANGKHPEEIADLAKLGGHASAKRGAIPHQNIHELLIAERAVECFEAEMWSEPSDIETFRSVLYAACSSSHLELPNICDADIISIREKLRISLQNWQTLEIGECMTMKWDED